MYGIFFIYVHSWVRLHEQKAQGDKNDGMMMTMVRSSSSNNKMDDDEVEGGVYNPK